MDEKQPDKQDIINLLAKCSYFKLIDNTLYIYNSASYMPAYTIRNDYDIDELRKESNKLRNREENDLKTFAKILKNMFKSIIVILLILFFGYGVFTSSDTIQSDRDNAVIICANALMNFENPYNYRTEINQPITTGLFNSFIAIPFVYLFGNIQLLSFLFYLVLLILIYKNNYLITALILLTPFLYRIMYYRLDELYWAVIYILGLFMLKSKWKYLLIIPILFSRNVFNFDFKVLLYNIDYWVLILLINNLAMIYLYKLYQKYFG